MPASSLEPLVSRPSVDLPAEEAQLVGERAGGDLNAARPEERGERLCEDALRGSQTVGRAVNAAAAGDGDADGAETRRAEPEEISHGAPDAGSVEEDEDVAEGTQVLYHALDGLGVRQAAEPLGEDGAGLLGTGIEDDEVREVGGLPEVESREERHGHTAHPPGRER